MLFALRLKKNRRDIFIVSQTNVTNVSSQEIFVKGCLCFWQKPDPCSDLSRCRMRFHSTRQMFGCCVARWLTVWIKL